MAWALTVGRWRGVPIKVHASTPIGFWVLSGFGFDPGFWLCTAALILLHELGHAWVVRRVGARATEVMLTGFGGHCAWQGEVTPLGRAAIACGGVAAQLLLLLVALTLGELGLWPKGQVGALTFVAATWRNAWLIGFNLLPIHPLDGAQAWAFPWHLGVQVRRRLSVHRNVTRVEGDFVQVGGAGAKAQAEELAAKLLEDARKPEGE